MSTAALLIIAKRWKQPKCLLHDKWIKVVYPYNGVLHIYSIYVQNNELLIYATTWMNLKIS